MPNYSFSLRNSQATPYPGRAREYPDLRSALVDANGKARALIRSRLRRADAPDLTGSLDVEDEQHRPVARIILAELSRQLF